MKGLKERFPDAKPWNVELFGGSPDDNNAFFFYDGAMSVLQPLIDSARSSSSPARPAWTWSAPCAGTARSPSRAWITCCRPTTPTPASHGVLSPYDGLSIGILSSLKGVGYGSADLPMPIVTGQDAEVPSVKSILAGEQYSTVFKDTRELAGVTVGMVDAHRSTAGSPRSTTPRPTTTASRSCRPTCWSPSRSTRPNWEEILVGSGYYTKDQIATESGRGAGLAARPATPEDATCSRSSRCAASPRRFPGVQGARQRQPDGDARRDPRRSSARTAPASRR